MTSLSRITALACIATPLVVLPAPSAHAQQPSLAPVEVIDTAPAPGSSLRLDVPAPTGSRLELAPRDTPASVSSISRADMAERSITRAQDAAVRMPGITEAPAPGNGGTRLAARGFLGHNSVAQLVDGTRLTVAVGTLTYPFSTWPLEAVEVLRGPASVLYGDGSIGAAVNYLTKQPLFARSEREAFASVGSFSTAQGGVGLRGPLGEALAYSLYVDAAHSDGYRRFEDYDRRNWSLALAARPMQGLKVTFSLDGGSNDDARYFGSPLQDGALVPALRRTIGCALVFVLVLFLWGVLTGLLRRPWNKLTDIKALDRSLGGVFGIVRAFVMGWVALLIFAHLPAIQDAAWFADSMLVPWLGRTLQALLQWLPQLAAHLPTHAV